MGDSNQKPEDNAKQLPFLPGSVLPVKHADESIEEEAGCGGEGSRVLLYNDESHTCQEVVVQLVRALCCPIQEATEIMLRAHIRGKSVVTITSRREAERIAAVLREIALMVKVENV